MHALVVGFGLGFLVAMQLGPMSLLLVRSTLRSGLSVGVAFAVGIAVVDMAYAALGGAGVTSVVDHDLVRIAVGTAGALLLAWLRVRTLRAASTVGLGDGGDGLQATPARALVVAMTATAANPATIVSWAAIFGAAASAGSTPSHLAAALLVVGVGLGSVTWMCLLAGAATAGRRFVTDRLLRRIDVVAGVGLLCFAVALAVATATR